MDLDDYDSSTTSFFTIDACDGVLAERMMQVLANTGTKALDMWKTLIEDNPVLDSRLRSQSVDEPKNRKSITWDNAVILFTCTLELNQQQRPIQLGEQLAKERFGRFPWGNGSAIEYLLEYLKPINVSKHSKGDNKFDEIILLLNKLNSFCIDSKYGGDSYANGMAGLNVLGLLNKSDVHQLRKNFTSRNWSVAADEPLDGGVRDAIKHLVQILKSAERRGVGMMLRSHS